MRELLLLIVCFCAKTVCGQDSTAAIYINDVVQKIEGRLPTDIFEKRDTAFYDKNDSLRKGMPLTVRTEFYTDPQTMKLDKIVEKSRYGTISTEMSIYFLADQPIRFTSKQREGSDLKTDFDIYYMNNVSVYYANRKNEKAEPDGAMFLRWCYELLSDYNRIVQEYNTTFQGRLK
jgi:hypothetical protein